MDIEITNNIISVHQSSCGLIDRIQIQRFFVDFDTFNFCWKLNNVYLSEKMSLKIIIELRKKFQFIFNNKVNIQKYDITKHLLLKELAKLHLCNDLVNLLFIYF
jgi:hypothetical protein